MSQDFAGVAAMATEMAELEARLSDPATHANPTEARRIGKRHAELRPLVTTWRQWQQLVDDEQAAREMGAEDPAFLDEAESLAQQREAVAEKLQQMLIPRDPMDGSDVIMEIKAGAGGEESALFAGDLLRMYAKYAERMGWSFSVIDAQESDMGGYTDITVAVKAKGAVAPEEAPYANLKYEGGVHRVQRVPVTEAQGRIHTSAAGVMVMPEAEEVEITIDPNDLRIDVYRSSGPGGQSVNTTDSAVRITHLPSGIVVSCQNEKSQLQNKESAMRILRARLLAAAEEEAAAAASDARRSQVRTVDRSERIRTYNFPENRIADHRTGYKANNLSAVLAGELGPLIESCIAADTKAKLEKIGN